MENSTIGMELTSQPHYDIIKSSSGDIWWNSLCGNATIRNAFWSYDLTINTANPDLTNCFQDTVLIWVPYGFLWISIIFYLPFLLMRKTVHAKWDFSLLNSLKVFIGVCLVGVCFLDIILRLQLQSVHLSSKIASFIKLISMIQVTFLLRLEFLKGVHTGLMFFIFWLMLTACNIVRLRSRILQYGDLEREDDNTLYVIYFAFYTLIFAQFVFTLFADMAAKKNKRQRSIHPEHQPLLSKQEPEGSRRNLSGKHELPELSVPAWNKVAFMWVIWEVIRGYRRPVTFDDLYDLKKENRCSTLLSAFYDLYKGTEAADYQPSITNEDWMSTYSVTSRASIRPSRTRWWKCSSKFGFFPSVFWAAGYQSVLGIFLMCISCALVLVQPQILRLLIIFIPMQDTYVWQGVALALALFLISVINSLVIQQFTFYCWSAGMKTRTVINSVVYRKAMRLSKTARKSTTVGEIVNLMSVDAQKVQDAFSYVIIIGQVPLLAIASFYFIYNTIGVATLAGVAVLLTLLPFNGLFMANITWKLQAKQMLAKDQRLKRMNEILSGIKILKLYGWEPPFIKKLLRYRNRELVSMKYANILNALSLVTWILCPFLLSLAIFSTYVLLSPDNILTAEKIFVTLSYINTFNYVISLFPVAVGFASQGYVSLQRISKFMKLDEIHEDYVEKHFLMKEAISIEDGSFKWEKTGRIILRDISLQVQRGQLIAVVGQVGAGKSSLISALLGEMTRASGTVKLNGSLAYVPQQAWIQNETVQENILFGKQFISKRYEDVIYACALKTDLRMLPGGDMTEIGEKGINLSGGQKQRVSLARAVYQNEDIYLLDDPLSAVDAHVGKHIFEKVIGPDGLLRKKTRILVTHGISFLPRTDVIVVIKDGRISEVGGYENLLQQNGAFAEFLRNNLLEHEEDDVSDETKELHRVLSALSGTESEREQKADKIKRRKKKTSAVSEDLIKDIPSVMSSRAASFSGDQEDASKLIEEEAMKVGSVKWSVIGTFIKAAGDKYFIITVLFNLLFTAFNVITNVWLSDWSRDAPVNGSMPQSEINNRLGVYGSLGAAQTVAVIVMMLASAYGCLSVSDTLHYKLLKRVMNAPLSWFDRTPLGRIMNRFSKDMDIIDTNVPFFLKGWLFGVSPLLATIVIICYITPVILAILLPFLILFLFLQRMYITYAGQLRRIDAMKRSPIFAHFDESVTGTSSIRAYNRLTQFTSRCNDLIDDSQQPYYMSIVGLRWLGVTMETLGAVLVFFAALLAVLNKTNLDSGMVGLSVTFALQVVVQLNSLVRCSAEMEMHMVSVERIDEYCQIEQEAAWRIPNMKLPFDWPSLGHITFDAYCTRYRICLDLVLKDINLNISPAEKVGIVGRTGAGKSSLALALFRILESAGGSISIDGFRIDKLGLHDVRSRLTIIPQDPVIFSGTLRDNLDPYEEYADWEIWNALDHTHLSTFVRPLEKGLYYECGESGESLSVGQRQLICLARALLRRSRVLILDEATAAIDLETDALIQQTIRTEFHECTVLTIAHRINTVLDYDKIMVLDRGRVVEFNKPSALLDNRRSMFFSLAQEAGIVQ